MKIWLSSETDTASISFWWGVIDIWWQIASELDQCEFPGAGRTGNFERIWYTCMHGGQPYFLVSLTILPRFRPFVQIWSVARVRKKYGCFAVYGDKHIKNFHFIFIHNNGVWNLDTLKLVIFYSSVKSTQHKSLKIQTCFVTKRSILSSLNFSV